MTTAMVASAALRAVRRAGSLAACEAGTAILEFAIVLPVLIALCAGCVELGRTLFVYSVAENAVRGGARFLAQVPDPTCAPTCSWGAARAIAMTVDQIVGNTGLPVSAVTVEPAPEPAPGTVVLQAEIEVRFILFAMAGRAASWTLRISHRERTIAHST